MANPLEAELHYPLADQLPPTGQTIEIAPGLRWLRMGLPFALNHINLWLLRDRDGDRDGWAVVDCGIDNAATRADWEQVFAHSLDGLPILRVIVTHMHPDHIGLAHWLCERWKTRTEDPGLPGRGEPPRGVASAASLGAHNTQDCRLWISATDWNAARMACQSTTGFGGGTAADHFARHGLSDPEALAKVRARTNYYPSLVPQVPQRFRRLMDGMELVVGDRRWRCIAGYGHAPEHIALYDAQAHVLISGDMVLPRISTNVSVIDLEPESDPLSLYLRSIEALRTLPQDTLVLPSHGKPFTGLHRRIEQLREHHDERLGAVMAACRERACSAAELLPVLFQRELDLHQTTFAMGESIAHLHLLVGRGLLQAQPPVDGVLRFRAMP